MKDKKKRKKKSEKRQRRTATWNTDDLDFDSSGRLVFKNTELAKGVLDQLTRDYGLLIQVSPEASGSIMDLMSDVRCLIPLFGCPNPNKAGCNDVLCGTRPLRVVDPDVLLGGASDGTAGMPDNDPMRPEV